MKIIISKSLMITVILLAVFLCFFSAAGAFMQPINEPRFIFIHLDGISYDLFLEELEAGNLPALAEFLEEGKLISGQTYYPPLTPVVISRIKQGQDISQGEVLSWKGYDRLNQSRISGKGIRDATALTMSRRGGTNSLYGNQLLLALELPLAEYLDKYIIPVTSRLGGPALVNAADLIERYKAVDCYWYSTDSYGHVFGREAQIGRLYAFDRSFGRLMRRLDDDVNVLIYSDHGMMFGDQPDPAEAIARIVGDNLAKYTYPNIYLWDQGEEQLAEGYQAEIARQLVEEDTISLVFYQDRCGCNDSSGCKDENKIIGYHEQGSIIISSRDNGINYIFSGQDFFNYEEVGYQGEYLSKEEWLELTFELEYPAAPPSIYGLMQNSNAGDLIIMTAFPGEGEFFAEGTAPGDHRTLHRLDMAVPVLVRGPELKQLYELDHVWLDSLMGRIPSLEPDDFFAEARENRYSFMLSAVSSRENPGESRLSEIQLVYSPMYRIRLGIKSGLTEIGYKEGWLEFDILSTQLSRFWLGVGNLLDYEPLTMGIRASYEIQLGRFGGSLTGYFPPGVRNYSLGFNYSLRPDLKINLIDFNRVGLEYSW